MKAVMMSIQPKWCELIASGKKTVEVRKTRPKLETPFKCYIYQTKKAWLYDIYSVIAGWQRKVIGEFVCDEISWIGQCGLVVKEDAEKVLKGTCLSCNEVYNYLGLPKPQNDDKYRECYGWHISDLVIYDEPKELSEFVVKHKKTVFSNEYNIEGIVYYPKEETVFKKLTKPPQSWCYVEELR